jgi:hypothetical protein
VYVVFHKDGRPGCLFPALYKETNMVDEKTLDDGRDDTSEELVELGSASRETRGVFTGVVYESSILPWRLLPPIGG